MRSSGASSPSVSFWSDHEDSHSERSACLLGFARLRGVIPGRTHELVAWAREWTEWHAEEPADTWLRVLADPQTSGGLLAAIPPDRVAAVEQALTAAGVASWCVGRVEASAEPGVALA